MRVSSTPPYTMRVSNAPSCRMQISKTLPHTKGVSNTPFYKMGLCIQRRFLTLHPIYSVIYIMGVSNTPPCTMRVSNARARVITQDCRVSIPRIRWHNVYTQSAPIYIFTCMYIYMYKYTRTCIYIYICIYLHSFTYCWFPHPGYSNLQLHSCHMRNQPGIPIGNHIYIYGVSHSSVCVTALTHLWLWCYMWFSRYNSAIYKCI